MKAESQYESLRNALHTTLHKTGWEVKQIRFIAGARSLNEGSLHNPKKINIPLIGIETIRYKLPMKFLDECANILEGLYIIGFSKDQAHISAEWDYAQTGPYVTSE